VSQIQQRIPLLGSGGRQNGCLETQIQVVYGRIQCIGKEKLLKKLRWGGKSKEIRQSMNKYIEVHHTLLNFTTFRDSCDVHLQNNEFNRAKVWTESVKAIWLLSSCFDRKWIVVSAQRVHLLVLNEFIGNQYPFLFTGMWHWRHDPRGPVRQWSWVGQWGLLVVCSYLDRQECPSFTWVRERQEMKGLQCFSNCEALGLYFQWNEAAAFLIFSCFQLLSRSSISHMLSSTC